MQSKDCPMYSSITICQITLLYNRFHEHICHFMSKLLLRDYGDQKSGFILSNWIRGLFCFLLVFVWWKSLSYYCGFSFFHFQSFHVNITVVRGFHECHYKLLANLHLDLIKYWKSFFLKSWIFWSPEEGMNTWLMVDIIGFRPW